MKTAALIAVTFAVFGWAFLLIFTDRYEYGLAVMVGFAVVCWILDTLMREEKS